MPDKTLQCAQGYLELGMFDSVLEELGRLPEQAAERPEALQIRLHALMQLKDWSTAVETGRRLCNVAPDEPAPFIHTAYCLHETGQTNEAKTTLLGGPEGLTSDPTYHYNLACYYATLGERKEAQQHLEETFSLDENFRHIARNDPDLKSLEDIF